MRHGDHDMKLRFAEILFVLYFLISTNASAEIYRGIQPGNSMTDVKALFPGAKFTFVKTAWATEGESLYDVSGPGLPGSMKIKFNDISVVFKKIVETNPEDENSEKYKSMATSSDDSMFVEWVRYVPENYIPIERLISKYGPAEKSGFAEDDFSPFRRWESKGVFATLTDNQKYVKLIDYIFTEKERCESYKQKGGTIPEYCHKNQEPKPPKKKSL